MTGSAPYAGDTQAPDDRPERPPGGPWATAGPDETWWRGGPTTAAEPQPDADSGAETAIDSGGQTATVTGADLPAAGPDRPLAPFDRWPGPPRAGRHAADPVAEPLALPTAAAAEPTVARSATVATATAEPAVVDLPSPAEPDIREERDAEEEPGPTPSPATDSAAAGSDSPAAGRRPIAADPDPVTAGPDPVTEHTVLEADAATQSAVDQADAAEPDTGQPHQPDQPDTDQPDTDEPVVTIMPLPATRPPAPVNRAPEEHAAAPPRRLVPTEIRSPAPVARRATVPVPAGPEVHAVDGQGTDVPRGPVVDDAPFWVPVEEVSREPAPWPVPRMRGGRPGSIHRSVLAGGRAAAPRAPRRTGPALVALVVLSLCAAFFGWVSAEPLWLALGHGDRGTATVTRCTGDGIGQRCVGRFSATDGFTATVTMLGVTANQRATGAAVDARMVDRDSRQAYVGDDHLALHLRWGVGLLLVLLCGAGIAWTTGATRLEDRRARRRAVLGSLAGPLLLAAGFLAAAW